jgi:hypothetical protein
VDEYRDIEDIVAACTLSSFVPGVTGPLAWSLPTISRASKKLKEMLDLGFIKKQRPNGEIVTVRPSSDSKLYPKPENYKGDFPYSLLDRGLSNAFPVIGKKAVVVTPMFGAFIPNPSISPNIDLDGKHPNTDSEDFEFQTEKQFQVAESKRLSQTSFEPAECFYYSANSLSADEDNLQRRYKQGRL